MATFRLTKDEQTKRDEFAAALRSAAEDVETAIAEANVAIAEATKSVQDKIADYNQAVINAQEFAEEIHSRLEADYSDKSEKWQEGEKGQAVSTFVEEWSNADWSEIDELDVPELEVPDFEHADTLEQLPIEPE